MNDNGIHTTADLILAAAEALAARDAEALGRLAAVNDGWLQGEGERAAQAAMLDAMAEAVAELAKHPGRRMLGGLLARGAGS